MKCLHCGKPIQRIVTRENRLVWKHLPGNIWCTTPTRAEPDVPIEQTEAWDLPAQEEAEHNQLRISGHS